MLLLVAAFTGCSGLFSIPEPEPETTAEETTVKEAVQMPGPWHRDAIDWAEAKRRPALDLAPLSESARHSIDGCRLPVLLPTDPVLLENLAMYTGDGWYAATMTTEAYQVFIRGTRMARPDMAAPPAADDGAIEWTNTAGVITASFSHAGAAYNVEIECAAGPSAPQCTELHAKALCDGLALAGGAEP